MTAYLYLSSEGYMVFETVHNFLKFLVPKNLTSLHEIKTYDNGYIVVETNYGEEYIDLAAIADEINLRLDFRSVWPLLRSA
jgi:hypothetical protein